MVDKIAALVAERDRAARSRDSELVEKLDRQLRDIASKATVPASRAAKRVLGAFENR